MYSKIHRKSPLSRVLALIGAVLALSFLLGALAPVRAQSNAFRQALAQAVAGDPAIAAFYKARDYAPIWTGPRDRQRRSALLAALREAPAHGLPRGRYDERAVRAEFSNLRSDARKAEVELRTTRAFLQYARDIQSGIVTPSRVDKDMTLRPPRRNPATLLASLAKSSPRAFFKSLPPQDPGYARLLKEKARMEKVVRRGGWGPTVPGRKLEPGQSGKAVQALRRRLAAMGYKSRGRASVYDDGLVQAVARFQDDHGLNRDGIAGKETLAAINTPAETRLMQTVIGLERLRWLNKPLGRRHIIVNEAAFSVNVYENGRSIYESRVVVGQPGRWRTPEFEDRMTHMVLNPSWYVPPSIAGGEYLPLLQENPNALARQDMEMTDADGNVVNPQSIDFSSFSKDDFPFSLRQKPSGGNALGKVKFLFPNKHAIYLHDTPAKRLFRFSRRAFSHGCVRVQKPFELAYTLLGWQSPNPRQLFDRTLATGEETRIDLKQPVPIYLVYRTAWVDADGRANYRADSYKVDGKLFAALKGAGVVLTGVRG